MKGKTLFIFILFLVLSACAAEPETVIETVVHETTVEVPMTVEVTRQVEVTNEVTREVEVTVEVPVEVTRLVEKVVTATPEPTPEPTLEPTPKPTSPPAAAPAAPAADLSTSLLNAMITARQNMEAFGGQIDAALRGAPYYCEETVHLYDAVANAPTFDVSGSTAVVQNAYSNYRSAIDHFTGGTRDLTENCRHAVAAQEGTTIPALQWTLARTVVNEAASRLNPAIQSLGGE